MPSISSNHNRLKLEIDNIRKMGKFINIWKLNSTLEQILGQRKHQKRILKIPLDKQK